MYMVRANSADPDKVYKAGKSVVLSPSVSLVDSMTALHFIEIF